jgi:hypothetical protein
MIQYYKENVKKMSRFWYKGFPFPRESYLTGTGISFILDIEAENQ